MDEGTSSSSGSGGDTDSASQPVEGDLSVSDSLMQSGGDEESMELEPDQSGVQGQEETADMDGNMDVHLDAEGADQAEDMLIEAGPSQAGKRVKVYELRDSSWFDRGTGHCKGVYDDTQDLALLIVEAEDMGDGSAAEGEGGFLKEELLLSARVEKEDIYARQQETLIVWTEPRSNLDIALSFQDPDGCEDIWAFISEVQRHLNNLPSDADPGASSPRLSASPPMVNFRPGMKWHSPTLANIKEQQILINMQSKSQVGRDKIIEHIMHGGWVKDLIGVFDQAEDLESLDDIHAVTNIIHTLFALNDNTILEYLLQNDIFMGVLGILEYDPEIPNHRAPYREHYSTIAKYREVVPIRDIAIRNKIHQTYRLHYLREVVLSRVLDEGTFGILNGFIFFNQVDIVTHVQNNDALLVELLSPFKGQTASAEPDETPLDEKKRDALIFLHQLLVLSKPVQIQNRLTLYRGLIDRGLLYVCEWAFRRREDQVLHTVSEILTLTLEHDTNAVRNHVIREEEAKTTTLLSEMIAIQGTTENTGLANHLSDSIRTLLDVPSENESFLQRKEAPVADNFITSFYESYATSLFKPISDLPNIEAGPIHKLPRHRIALLIMLIELLSFCVLHHAHRASYFVLSNPISKKVFSLLRIKDKPLRYAVLRYARTCFRTPNHFIHRYFVKQDLIPPLLELLEEESTRDNMLSSSCMDVLSAIRTENIKPILNYMFEHYRERIEAIGRRPYLRAGIQALTSKWEQNNEPPPAPPQIEQESVTPWKREAAEEDYFNASDDEESVQKSGSGSMPTRDQRSGRSDFFKRFSQTGRAAKRVKVPKQRQAQGRQGSRSLSESATNASADTAETDDKPATPALGLDYDDGSDSDSSNGAQSPRSAGGHVLSSPTSTSAGQGTLSSEDLEEDLTDVTMRMRAKRQREEEEDADFAGLFGTLSKGGAVKKSADESIKQDSVKTQVVRPDTSTPAEEGKTDDEPGLLTPGKRLKLNLGFGRKTK